MRFLALTEPCTSLLCKLSVFYPGPNMHTVRVSHCTICNFPHCSNQYQIIQAPSAHRYQMLPTLVLQYTFIHCYHRTKQSMLLGYTTRLLHFTTVPFTVTTSTNQSRLLAFNIRLPRVTKSYYSLLAFTFTIKAYQSKFLVYKISPPLAIKCY